MKGSSGLGQWPKRKQKIGQVNTLREAEDKVIISMTSGCTGKRLGSCLF